jgi:hypothetical protein
MMSSNQIKEILFNHSGKSMEDSQGTKNRTAI